MSRIFPAIVGAYAEQGLRNYRPYVRLDIRLTHSAAECRCRGFAAVAPGAGRERENIHHLQAIDVTIKINLCGRLPGRKFPSSWPPMPIQIILFYI